MAALPKDLAQAVSSCAARLRARFGARVRMVRLFGSWARGQAREGSDIDLAAVIDGLTRDEWREAIDIATQDELETGVYFSPYLVSGEHFDELCRRERRIAADILAEGIAP